MTNNRNNIEKHNQWKFNSGNNSFLWDNWLGEGQLVLFSNKRKKIDNRKLANFWVDGQWNYQLSIQQAPLNQLENIRATTIPQQHVPDRAYWKANSNDMFTCFYSWNEICGKKATDHFSGLIWYSHIPFKEQISSLEGYKWKASD